MYQCKTFEWYSLDGLERCVNEWFEEMKGYGVVMHDVHFHYAVRKSEYSVLVTYRVEEETK